MLLTGLSVTESRQGLQAPIARTLKSPPRLSLAASGGGQAVASFLPCNGRDLLLLLAGADPAPCTPATKLPGELLPRGSRFREAAPGKGRKCCCRQWRSCTQRRAAPERAQALLPVGCRAPTPARCLSPGREGGREAGSTQLAAWK